MKCLTNPEEIPDEITLFILPIANPDGYHAGRDRVRGRTNGNRVDLNRNWDYEWQSNAFHGQWPISGGSAPFSEHVAIDWPQNLRGLRAFLRWRLPAEATTAPHPASLAI